MNCQQCGKPIPPRNGGRPRLYCSGACKSKAARQRRANRHETQGNVTRTGTKPPENTEPELREEDFTEMLDPIGSYEDLLRMTIRKLKHVMQDPDTPARDLPAISRVMLQAAKDLDNLNPPDAPPIDVKTTPDDHTFNIDAI